MHDTVQLALLIRQTCLTLCHTKNASHLGGAFSVADIMAVLYGHSLEHNPQQPRMPERDRLFYSKGHACTALYSALAHSGYFPVEQLLNEFTENGSFFTSHVNHHVPGVELSTGSLGHALGVAAGVTLAGERRHKDYRVYAILSDGELDEGSNWEAILFAGHHHLSRLTMVIDYNKIQSFGHVEDVLGLEPLADKLTAFGWAVAEVDGHDHEALKTVFSMATSQPLAVIAHTVKGKGVSFMENQLAWHYKSPKHDEYALALAELGGAQP